MPIWYRINNFWVILKWLSPSKKAFAGLDGTPLVRSVGEVGVEPWVKWCQWIVAHLPFSNLKSERVSTINLTRGTSKGDCHSTQENCFRQSAFSVCLSKGCNSILTPIKEINSGSLLKLWLLSSQTCQHVCICFLCAVSTLLLSILPQFVCCFI